MINEPGTLRQSRPDCDLGCKNKLLNSFLFFPSSLESGMIHGNFGIWTIKVKYLSACKGHTHHSWRQRQTQFAERHPQRVAPVLLFGRCGARSGRRRQGGAVLHTHAKLLFQPKRMSARRRNRCPTQIWRSSDSQSQTLALAFR